VKHYFEGVEETSCEDGFVVLTHWPAGRPRGLAARPPLGELPPQPSRWSSPTAL
jgi:hypothetical protein